MSIDQEQSATHLLCVGAELRRSDSLREHLSRLDTSVALHTATTEREAVRTVAQERVTGVVAEADLPECDGIDVLEACLERKPGLLAILVSERQSRALLDRAYEAGVDEFVHDTGRAAWGIGVRALETHLDGTAAAVQRPDRFTETLVDAVPDAIVIIDADGTVSYINDRAADVFDLDVYDGPLTDVELSVDLLSFEGDVVDVQTLPHRRVVESGETVSGEARLDVGDEQRWVSVNGAPLCDDDGTVTSAVFSLQDVTDRKGRERQLQRYETVVETVGDAVYALDDDDRFVVVNDAYTDLTGYDREELLGEPAGEFVDDRIIEEARSLQERIRRNGTDEATLEVTVPTAAGVRVPVEVRLSLFEFEPGRYGRVGVVRDISERKRREDRLARLNEVGQALTTAETPDAVADVVVDGARETLDLPLATVEFYDDESGTLGRGPRTPELESLVGTAPLFESEWDLPWQVYAESDSRVIDDVGAETPLDDETPLESVIVLPVGTHGVFIAGATEPNAFTDTDVTVSEILAANAVAALDRVERERELKEKNDRLADRNESLERSNRLNTVIRSLTRQLIQASTREDVERAVCTELAAVDPYVFAWIGGRSAAGDEVTPRTSAGSGDGYLDAVTVETDGADAGLPGDALQRNEPVFANDLQDDPPFEPWRRQALRRGYRAGVAVPLTYRDTVYGVLTLYATEPDVFDDREVAVLAELGDVIGYAITAIERKKAIVSDAAVELTFRLDDRSIPAVAFAAEADAAFEFEALVERSDGHLRAFFTVYGADPDTVVEYASQVATVQDLSVLSDNGEGHQFEARVTASSFFGDLLSYGAHPTSMTVDSTGAELTVEVPQSGDVQSFVRTVVDAYDDAELLARRDRDRPIQTLAEFRATYEDRLTDRQREVLETAYCSGFFEWPRETSGQELASILDVSQPTISRHVRTGERELLKLVFEDGT